MEDGILKVVAPIDDTPAAKAGIRAGDIITHLDDEALQGLTLNQAVEKMRGRVNSKIKLKILRKGVEKPLDVAITRETIRVRSVRGHNEGDDVGYVRITQFNEQVADGLRKAINDITSQLGADKVIKFDRRFNGRRGMSIRNSLPRRRGRTSRRPPSTPTILTIRKGDTVLIPTRHYAVHDRHLKHA